MTRTNKNINSQDEIHQLTMYPEAYNVRHLPVSKALPEEKQKVFNKLNEKYFTVKTF